MGNICMGNIGMGNIYMGDIYMGNICMGNIWMSNSNTGPVWCNLKCRHTPVFSKMLKIVVNSQHCS